MNNVNLDSLIASGTLKEEHLFLWVAENAEKKRKQDSVNQFKNITTELLETYVRKNADYGNSFGESLDEDGLIASKTRIGDKFRRFSSLIKNDALVNDESIEDTLLDMANYAIMTVMWMRSQDKQISMNLDDIYYAGTDADGDLLVLRGH